MRELKEKIGESFFTEDVSAGKMPHKIPLELEALATMDFVSNTMKCSTKEQIVNTFREIKGNKFSESIIEESYRNFQEFGLIEVA